MRTHLYVGCVAVIITCQAAAQSAPLQGTLRKIKETNTIVIGYRETSVPFSFLDEREQPAGYSIDLCQKIVTAVKEKLSLKDLKVRYLAVNSQNRLPLVANGTVDMECGVTSNTEDRQRQVGFTYDTYVTGLSFLTRKGSATELKDLKGKIVSVAAGSTNELSLKRLNSEQKLDMTILPAKDTGEAFLLLETGRSDAYASDEILLYAKRSKSKTPADFQVMGRLLSFEPYSIVIRRGDPEFQSVANASLKTLFQSSEIQKIYDRWFRTPNFNVPMNDATKGAFAAPTDKAAH